MIKPYLKDSYGFSLFEVLVIIAILSVLIILSYLYLPSQIAKARDAVRKTHLHKIRLALEEYNVSKGSYPTELPECGQPIKSGNEIILKKVFCDPKTKKPYYYQTKTGEPKSFRLYALLENNKDRIIDEIGCEGGCGKDCLYNYGVHSPNIDLIKCSYVCAPGGGKAGSCELYQNSVASECPVTFQNDFTCKNSCSNTKNRCKNASGKHIPY